MSSLRESKTRPHGSQLWLLLPVLALPLLSWGLYAEFRAYPFVYDDYWNIVENPALHLDSLEGPALLAALEGHFRNRTRPLSNLGFALSYAVWGLDPAGFRGVGIGLHGVNAVLLFLLLLKTLRLASSKEPGPPVGWSLTRPWGAAFAGTLVWLVHPLHSHAVMSIHQRMVLQAAFFCLLALHAYLAARQTSGRRRQIWAGLAGFAWLCGMLSKEVALGLALAVWVYEVCIFRRLDPVWTRRSLRVLLPSALLGICLLGGLLFILHPGYAHKQLAQIRQSLAGQLLTQVRVLFFYLSLWLWPHPARLSIDHGLAPSSSLLAPPTNLLALLALTGLMVWLWRTRRPLRVLQAGWFLLLLLLEALLPLDAVAEYRLYLPGFAIALCIAELLPRYLPRRFGRWGWLPVLLILGLLCQATRTRCRVWRDPVSLWSDAAAHAPDSYRPRYNLGFELLRSDDAEAALPHLRRAVELKSGSALAHGYLAVCLAQQGLLEEAYPHSERAVALDKKQDWLHLLRNQALIARRLGRPDEVLALLQTVAEREPRAANYVAAARQALRCARPELALQLFGAALRLAPQDLDARTGMIKAQAKATGVGAALRQLQTWLNDGSAHADLWLLGAELLTVAGEQGKTIELLREARRRFPNDTRLVAALRKAEEP